MKASQTRGCTHVVEIAGASTLLESHWLLPLDCIVLYPSPMLSIFRVVCTNRIVYIVISHLSRTIKACKPPLHVLTLSK